MKVTPNRIRPLTVLAFFAGAAALAGCATQPMNSMQAAGLMQPLETALSAPVADLRRSAEAGEASAQYAMSLLLQHGLRGETADAAAAAALRRKAVAPRSVSTVPYYIAGVNGQPGRMHFHSTPQYDLSPAAVGMMDACVTEVAAKTPSEEANARCGGEQTFAWLRRRWAGEEAPPPVSWRVANLKCHDESVVSGLWSIAARSFASDPALATTLTDRIINACGTAEPSWHPRVMRALIALGDKQADKALQLLEPVPRPGPAPIGSYSSFVAMAAHAAKGDWASYARERDTLMAASGRALADPSGAVKARAVEQITVGGYRVSAYELTLQQGDFTRLIAFLATPTDPKGEPLSFYLTTYPSVLDPTKNSYFIDQYSCFGHATLDILEERPTYATVRETVVRSLNGQAAPTSSSARPMTGPACNYPSYLAPGLGD
jgi:hypothetical protein